MVDPLYSSLVQILHAASALLKKSYIVDRGRLPPLRIREKLYQVPAQHHRAMSLNNHRAITRLLYLINCSRFILRGTALLSSLCWYLSRNCFDQAPVHVGAMPRSLQEVFGPAQIKRNQRNEI